MTTSWRHVPLALLCSGIASLPALAADPPAATPAATELPKLTVTETADSGYVAPNATTGTKTDTPLIDTPVSVQVIPQQVLQDQKALTLDQALKNVSGVRGHDSSGISENIDIRGFNTGHQTTFRNGFRIDQDLSGGHRSLSNVESIEVLKGPAAVLYGRVEPGGIVNLITKKPQATPLYEVEQQLGSWDHFLTVLGATGPVNDDRTLLYRMDATYESNHSYRDAIYNRTLFLAPSLRWNLSPQTQVTVEAEYDHNTVIDDESLALPYDEAAGQFVWLPRSRNLTPSRPVIIDTKLLGLNWSHQFNDAWTLRQAVISHRSSLTTEGIMVLYGFNQVGNSWTADRGFVDFHDSGTNTAATSIDLTGHLRTGALKHTLLLGVDFYRVTTPYRFQYSNAGATIDVFTMVDSGPPLVLDPTMWAAADGTNKSYGAYVQDQVELPSQVYLLGGLRYQKVTHTGWSAAGSGFGSDGTSVPDTPQDDHAVTPRAGLLWKPRDWLSVYASYSRNFGANNGRDWQDQPLPPESAKQYETGAKASMLDGKVNGTVALYELTKTNVAAPDPNPDPQHFGRSIAIGEIRSRGIEFDLQGEIARGWDVIASYSHNNVIITKTTPDSGYVVGNRIAGQPRNMANVGTTFSLRGQRLAGWKIGGDINWTDSTVNGANTLTTPAYLLVDAMVAYEPETRWHKLSMQLNVDNLLDKTYYFNADAFGNFAVMGYGRPRSVKASVRVEF